MARNEEALELRRRWTRSIGLLHYFHAALFYVLNQTRSEFARILIARISAQQPSILAAVEPNPLDEVLPKLPHRA